MFKQLIKAAEDATFRFAARSGLTEHVPNGRAQVWIAHRRPYDLDERTGLFHYKYVDEPEIVWNLITNPGRIFLHTQGYGTAGLVTNGLNFIALSNDAVTETATSTVLSNEITLNGLGRAVGTVTLPVGAGNQTTVDKIFTASGAQSAQKSALFSLVSGGTMNHVLGFSPRSLITSDTLEITATISLA